MKFLVVTDGLIFRAHNELQKLLLVTRELRMNERICLTRSNWQEERREFEDDVRGILLPESAAVGGASGSDP